MSDPYVIGDELSEIASTCTTARGGGGGGLNERGFGLSVRAVTTTPARFASFSPGPLPEGHGADRELAAELEKLRDEDDIAAGAKEGTFADPSVQRISALEAALGEANRELRARAQAEEQLILRVDELVRVAEEQRAIIAARDAEIVRLTTQAALVAEVPKSRTRHRRSNHARDTTTSQTALPALEGSGSTSAVPTLPPLVAGPRSHSSLL
jgi:hypothetical protein